ncbi:DUF4238 domain-containing protein [uncultured Psychrobacter sp.]|jgi:hypothetical protein|uniref:DUF4238 domain-containing protein n=1 Tax=uncultured Psychrobacter sp. TaxID=259303 RepID=UPI0025992814|nr:DUF4238 domain-containing protein [uncultured Psychrobacter sp.]
MVTDKKNQHYVPKFYLRNFSFEDNKKQIGLFNLENEFYIKRAKLKTQASKNFFYGRDGVIEDQLANIEGDLSNTIKHIVEESSLPKRYSQGHSKLLSFAVLTDLRNPTRLKQNQQMANEILKFFPSNEKSNNIKNTAPLFSPEAMIEMSLKSVPNLINDIKDLNYKLLINETMIPFITSDYPVVRYNQFLEEREHPPSNTGYGSVGLQIFIPLNGHITLVLYDENIYKIGNKKQNTVVLTQEKDVDQLNILQFVNCFSTIYFNHQADENYINYLFKKSKKYERANDVLFSSGRLINGQHEISSSYANEEDNLLIYNDKDCEINLNLTVMKVHSKGKKYKMVDSVVQTRRHVINQKSDKTYLAQHILGNKKERTHYR